MRQIFLFLLLIGGTIAQAQIESSDMSDETLSDWLADFRPRALQEGITETTLEQSLPGIRFLPTVIERDRNQNEFSKTIWEYLDSAVSDARVANGQRALTENAQVLEQIEATYGVDRHIIAAIWGLESAYGAVRGDTPTLSALATLAHEGRRGAFFERQLLAALQILDQGDTNPENMRGSWAGAMGHTQFMPTAHNALAVDYDGDGRRDIWGDDPTDALASTAAFLADAGWDQGQIWGTEVTLPADFDYNEARRKGTRLPSAWASNGVLAVSGESISDGNGGGSILLPAGASGPAFMVFGNFKALERYNTADAYVIAVGYLADRLAGRAEIQHTWPRQDRALTYDERIALQELLTEAGFSTLGVDGLIGPNTIGAIRSYQRANDLLPDGYASVRILGILRNED